MSAPLQAYARTHADLPAAAGRGAESFFADQSRPPDAVRVCRGTSCLLAGADRLERRLAARTACSPVYCVGYCDRSPAMLRGDGAPVVGVEALEPVLDAKPPPLPGPPAVRCLAGRPIVTRRAGRGDFCDLDAARRDGAYRALRKALDMAPSEVIDAVERSGERGRGGGAFPVGSKWRRGAAAPGAVKYAIANGDEGDPGSFVDRVLMEQDPHAVLEGLAICAYAIGAAEGIVFVRSEYPAAIERVVRAADDARAAGILGPSAMGTGFAFDVRVVRGLGSYVCGEETAMLNAIEGLRGEVRLRPPYPTQCGLHGKPTVVNNVETLVNVSWIIEHGADAYGSLGTAESSGTKAMCLNHGFESPGIVEVEFGTPLRRLIEGSAGPNPPAAVALGGPMGSILTPDEWDVPICYTAMGRVGIQLGHGGMVAIPPGADFRGLLTHWLEFMQHESCGKCVPCRAGSRRALELVRNGDGDGQVGRLLEVMADASLCAFGREMPRPMRKLLELSS